jgi:hypothetical protein
MKQFFLLLCAGSVAILGYAQTSKNPFAGRWDIVATPTQGDAYPHWMEISEKNGALDVYFQPRGGGARHIAAKVEGSHLTFSIQAGRDGAAETIWDLTAAGDKLSGAQKRGNTVQATLAAVRAPKLDRPMPKNWTKAEPLFNGKDLSGWEPIGDAKNSHWTVKNGDLVNEDHGANLKSVRKFDDFKLHFEVNCPEKGNSGFYLRGRYEIQVENEPAGTEDKFHMMGAIYSHLAPAVDAPRKPGEWETFDVTLVGRRVTIVRNGVTTIDNQEIPGITGGALDSNEGQPGSFYIQGDHTGGLSYRNITIAVPAK